MAVVPGVSAPCKKGQQREQEPPEDWRGASITGPRLLAQTVRELIPKAGKARGVAVEAPERVVSLDVNLRQRVLEQLAEAFRRLAADDRGEEGVRAVAPPDQQLAESHRVDFAPGG